MLRCRAKLGQVWRSVGPGELYLIVAVHVDHVVQGNLWATVLNLETGKTHEFVPLASLNSDMWEAFT